MSGGTRGLAFAGWANPLKSASLSRNFGRYTSSCSTASELYRSECVHPVDREIRSPLQGGSRPNPMREAVLNGAHRSYVHSSPPPHPRARAMGVRLAVRSWQGQIAEIC